MAKNILRDYIDASGDDVSVEEGIIDRTSTGGMTDRALQILEGARQGARAVGLAKIKITAAKGGGHKSHRAGTEWDIKGYNKDGSLWSNAQRVGVAEGARQAGSDRVGVYQMTKGLGAGTLHLGYSGPGRPAAVWGAFGRTSGPKSRQFTDPAEKAFYEAYANGQPLDLSRLSVTWTSDAIPTPRNPIPGVPDPTAPIPRANPIGAPQPEGSIGMGIGATGGVQAAGSAQLDLTPAPKPRARPSPIEKTIARIASGRPLRKGAKGEEVAEVQRVLNAMGVRDSRGRPLEIDGNLGVRTRQAIAAYQSRYSHLVTDGVLGTRTLAQLMNDVARTEAPVMEAGQVIDPGLAGSEMSVSDIAANMGADLARGFQTRGVGVDPWGNVAPVTPSGANPVAAFQAFQRPGMTVAGSSGLRIPSSLEQMDAYGPARPISRTPLSAYSTQLEVANAFTPHSGGQLGAATLDRDAESIYGATTAFALARVADRERFGGSPFATNSRGKLFESEVARDPFGALRHSGSTLKGTGVSASNLAQGAGFRPRSESSGGGRGFNSRTSNIAQGAGSRASDPLTRAQESRRSSGTASRANDPLTRAQESRSRSSGTVRRTGSFGHTSSGRPIGGV